MYIQLKKDKRKSPYNTTQTTANPCFAMGSPRSGYPLATSIKNNHDEENIKNIFQTFPRNISDYCYEDFDYDII
jgi:hypothetical protein